MKSKTRRKLTFRRFAYYLLITAIVASCVTNGIFAKFTTEDAGGDGARVAKFGIVLSVSGDLFSTTYNKYEAVDGVETANSNKPTSYTTTATEDDSISVQAHYKYVLADGTGTDTAGTTTKLNNVIAPGTKNYDGINISIKGKAETDCVIEYEIASSTICLKTNHYDEYDDDPSVAGVWPVYNYQGLTGTAYSYCVMVPTKENIIRADNFEEFKDTLYTSATVDGKVTYTKVIGDFDDSTDYYQAKDVAVYEQDYYMPIIFKPYGYSSLADLNEGDIPSIDKIPDVMTYNERKTSIITKTIQHLNDYVLGQLITNELNNNVKSEKFPYECVSTGKSKIIETGESLNIDFNLIWEWPFLGVDEEEESEVNSCDTILGHLMAGNEVFKSADNGATYIEAVEGEDYNLEIEFDINITINQVD